MADPIPIILLTTTTTTLTRRISSTSIPMEGRMRNFVVVKLSIRCNEVIAHVQANKLDHKLRKRSALLLD